MGKRKAAKRVIKSVKITLDKAFDCPFCNGEQCVEVKMKRTKGIGLVYCRICEEKYTYPINELMKEAHVFSKFIEECENANEQEAE